MDRSIAVSVYPKNRIKPENGLTEVHYHEKAASLLTVAETDLYGTD